MNSEDTTKNVDLRPVTKIIASYVGHHTLTPDQLSALIVSVQQTLVVSDLPVFREIFGDAATFATGPIALATALRTALTDPSPLRRDEGRAVAAGYTWQAAAEAHLAFYASLS